MFEFIIKGILRDRSRSLLPLILIATGVFVTSVYYSFIGGYERIAIESTSRFDSGHVKVVTRAYAEDLDERPYDLGILGVADLKADLEKELPQFNWYERIQFGGLMDVPDAEGETIVQGESAALAVDLSQGSEELELLNLNEAIELGELPDQPNEVLLSKGLFEKLEIELGQEVSMITATMYGGMAVGNYTVSGVVQFGIPVLDRGMMLMDIKDAQQLLDMEDGAGEILGLFKDGEYHWNTAVEVVNNFNEKFSKPEDEFSPEMIPIHKQGDMESTLVWMRSATYIIIVFFIFIMGLVLWNLGLINGIRRYGEMGLRLAIGENSWHIYWSMILEAVVIGFIGSVIGSFFGVLAGYYLQANPFDMSHYLKNATVLMSADISANVDWFSYVVGFIPGFLATVAGAAFAGVAIFRRNTATLFKELEQ